MADNIHEGHRERARMRYDKLDIDDIRDYEILELLLFYVIPQKDTKPTAYKLIKHFGSLQNVLEAPRAKLERMEGVGEKAARYLNLLGETFEQIKTGKMPDKLTSETSEQFFKKLFKNEVQEAFYIICLDAKDNILARKKLSEGSFESVEMDPVKAVKVAMDYNSAQVVFAHNHPSGSTIASNADIELTKLLDRTMNFMGIRMRDHIIYTDEKCVSIVDNYDIRANKGHKGRGGRR